MSKDQTSNLNQSVEIVDNSVFKIRFFTYNNGYKDVDILAKNKKEAARKAWEIVDSERGWFWHWLSK